MAISGRRWSSARKSSAEIFSASTASVALTVARRLLAVGSDREVGDALLDQRVIAGIGNAIRTEACFRARVSPWRRIGDLDADEAAGLIGHSERVMRLSLEGGTRPRSIYRATGRACPVCGTTIRSRGQGDANRIAYWCDGCQR